VTSGKASPSGGDAEPKASGGPAPPDEAGAATGPDTPDTKAATGGRDGAGSKADAPGAADEAGEVEADDQVVGDEAGEDKGEGDAADEVLRAAAEALEVDLELLLAEREQYLDAYRRAQADFENYRKQAQKRQDDAVVRSLGSFVEGLLPVLDSCDAALAHGASEVEPVLSALYGALAKEGLERIDPKGSTFDPAEAEAVMHEPGEGGEQVVAEVLRPGYRWRGRVLRPAMVKVTD
jgi:molecular chaperone GrpE